MQFQYIPSCLRHDQKNSYVVAAIPAVGLTLSRMPKKRKASAAALKQEQAELLEAVTDSSILGNLAPPPPPSPKQARRSREDEEPVLPIEGATTSFNDMLFQLLHYKAVHGDVRVKARDESHRKLHDWMMAQRKAYRIFQETPHMSPLTEDQVKVLNFVQFPWNTRGEEHWARNYEHLKEFRRQHNHTMVPRTYQDVQNLCHWVTDQRRQLKNLRQGKPSTMTKERQKLLDEVGFVWQVRNRTTWDVRFQELVDFKESRGTTIVPQHFSENRALGKWVRNENRLRHVCVCVCLYGVLPGKLKPLFFVSFQVAKQREQYKLLLKGEHSFLTPDRREQLESIGFVWSMKGRSPKEESPARHDAIGAEHDSPQENSEQPSSVVSSAARMAADNANEAQPAASV